MYKVYILKSLKDEKYYIGQTRDLEMRLEYHCRGRVKATKNRRPLELVYTESFERRAGAMKREKYLKSLKGGNEFNKIIGVR